MQYLARFFYWIWLVRLKYIDRLVYLGFLPKMTPLPHLVEVCGVPVLAGLLGTFDMKPDRILLYLIGGCIILFIDGCIMDFCYHLGRICIL